MKILLKDNKEYEIEYFSESFRIDEEENENIITIEIKEDLSLEEMKKIFTQDNLSSFRIITLANPDGFLFEGKTLKSVDFRVEQFYTRRILRLK